MTVYDDYLKEEVEVQDDITPETDSDIVKEEEQ